MVQGLFAAFVTAKNYCRVPIQPKFSRVSGATEVPFTAYFLTINVQFVKATGMFSALAAMSIVLIRKRELSDRLLNSSGPAHSPGI
jgi:hypothetical protein